MPLLHLSTWKIPENLFLEKQMNPTAAKKNIHMFKSDIVLVQMLNKDEEHVVILGVSFE